MAENKDFLGSLAKEVENKPDSFKEERVEKITRPNPFKPKTVISVLVVLALIASGVYYFFLRPNIVMQDFVGRKVSDFTAWARQNDIDSQGVLVVEEYSFEHAKDIVISQDIEEGQKIKKDAKMTITVSLGADPSEVVAFPALMTMMLSEINTWIADNKLLNTRVTTTYDDKILQDEVISYDLKNIEESEFTRGSTLTIVVSKGVKPAATITVTTDYVDQAYSIFKSWADTNKLVIEMSESYNNTIALGNIVSLSVAKDDKVKEGDTIKVVVSKGPAVKMIYLDAYTQERVTDWAAANNVTVRFKETYHATIGKDIVVYQSITSGTIIKDDDILIVGISLGKPKLDVTPGSTVSTLQETINGLNEDGANLSINPSYTYEINDLAPGSIIRVSNLSSVTVGTKLNLVISEGKNILLVDYKGSADATDDDEYLSWGDVVASPNAYSEFDINKLCGTNAGVSCKITYQNGDPLLNTKVLSISRSDGKPLIKDTYIKQSVSINIVICDTNS